MMLILSLGLLPLGIIAIAASIDNARENRAQGQVEAQALLAVHAQRYTLAISRSAYTLRAARDGILEASDPSGICGRTLDRLMRLPTAHGRYAIYGENGQLRCASIGFVPPPIPAANGESARVQILSGGEGLRSFLFDPAGRIEGIAEYPRAALADVVNTPPVEGGFGLELVQGDRILQLREGSAARVLEDEIVADFPIADGQYVMRIHTAAPPVTLAALLIILTPVLMWLWASVIGWALVQRLLLRPLKRVQNIIAAYQPGDPGIDFPAVRSPAQEIGDLGQSFARVTHVVARHEAELEAAVERQTKLVREVHHRVKNNLQVVASLLNLHSRGSPNEEAAAAYASIQRRVDALAVVHRNHYAELEENRGVALKPLISELAANLRATAPARAAGMQIRLDIAPVHAHQDVAVPVAFLITEITEYGMLCGASLVSIVLETDDPGTARLTLEVDSLAGPVECDAMVSERFERIITGLARQLRTPLDHDPDKGRYSLRISIVGVGPR